MVESAATVRGLRWGFPCSLLGTSRDCSASYAPDELSAHQSSLSSERRSADEGGCKLKRTNRLVPYGWGSVVWGARSGLMIVVALLGPLEQWYGGSEPMAGCTTKEQGRPLSLCTTKATRRTTTTAKATSTAHPRRTPRRVTRANSKVSVGSPTTVPRYARGGPDEPATTGWSLACGANTADPGRRVVAKAASRVRICFSGRP